MAHQASEKCVAQPWVIGAERQNATSRGDRGGWFVRVEGSTRKDVIRSGQDRERGGFLWTFEVGSVSKQSEVQQSHDLGSKLSSVHS